MTPDEVIQLYRGALSHYRPTTVDNYSLQARKLAEWQSAHGADFPEVSEFEFLRYFDYRREELGNSETTLHSAHSALKNFFTWATERGLVRNSPIGAVQTTYVGQPRARDTFTLDELRSMWEAAPTLKHKVLVGLLGLTGMRPDEVLGLDVTHLVKLGEHYSFHLVGRFDTRPVSYVLLSPQVLATVRELVGDRRSGPLLIRADGKRLDRRTSDRWVKRTAELAGIPFRVSQMTLTYTLRAIAIERNFSYVGVIRAAGELSPTKSRRWLIGAPNIPEENAAIRLSQLLFNDPSSSLGMLSEANTCLHQTDLPPAIAVAVAGAALEKHLRDLCMLHQIRVSKDEKHRKIGTYVSELSRQKHVTSGETQRLQAIQSHRDDAAHGWFERVAHDTAVWVIRECLTFIENHPV